ncbi:BQ2448_2426 [Microbotryum intermedium]|uniref:BQ2448_2426 protein n=1 Tax=Microbotryum intermedium TaxID=269621 RepID=A0A238FE84_9BASI|nr:BQ2448_2426 [Microbotryum intermedium]
MANSATAHSPPSKVQASDFDFLSFHSTATAAPQQPATFLLDSATPFHIVNDSSLFAGDLKPISLRVGGIGGHAAVTGIGSVKLRTDVGAVVKLINVYLAPQAPASLISVFQLDS